MLSLILCSVVADGDDDVLSDDSFDQEAHDTTIGTEAWNDIIRKVGAGNKRNAPPPNRPAKTPRIQKHSLLQGVKKNRDSGPPYVPPSQDPAVNAEMARMRRENERLKRELDEYSADSSYRTRYYLTYCLFGSDWLIILGMKTL